MKIMTIVGTRPEIIRLSRIIPLLDRMCHHVLVHTGQNYDPDLSDIFFSQLGIRAPDYYLGCRGTTAAQIGCILTGCEELLIRESPDRLLILGDTNSALSAIIASRHFIPVYHMEAGNRCYDQKVPEEVNRRLVDHVSRFLLPYTERSRLNLLREGIEGQRIFVTGNPIWEVINYYQKQIKDSRAFEQYGLTPGNYILVTLHRTENVDNPSRLKDLVASIKLIEQELSLPILCSLHPHTRARLSALGLTLDGPKIKAVTPLGFFDFVGLEKRAALVLTDSGTVQEECCLLGVPSVTLRDVTERPETVECGSSILAGSRPENVLGAARAALNLGTKWSPPPEYLRDDVSITVARIILGQHLLMEEQR